VIVYIIAGNAGMYNDEKSAKMISEMEGNNGTDFVDFHCDTVMNFKKMLAL
jgi:hypothetical protein